MNTKIIITALLACLVAAWAPAQTVPPGDLEQTFDELEVSLGLDNSGETPAILLSVTALNNHVVEDIWFSEVTKRLMIVASPAEFAVTDPRAAGVPVKYIAGLVPTDGTESLLFQIHIRDTPATPAP